MIGNLKKEIDDNYDKMFSMETKYMSLKELREYKDMARHCQSNRVKIALIFLLGAAVLYSLSFTVCFITGMNVWMIASVYMLFIGASGTMLIYALCYDKARRAREAMDDRYIKAEELDDIKTMDEQE